MDGKKIRDLRVKRGISLTELSKLSGVSKSYLSFIERGKQKNPSIEVIDKLAKALKVDVQVLLMTDLPKKKPSNSMPILDKDVIELAIEMTRANIDKEKLRQLIEILK